LNGFSGRIGLSDNDDEEHIPEKDYSFLSILKYVFYSNKN
jgi:hypothetical protein